MGLGHRWTQGPTGTRVCKQRHVHLETGVHTSTHVHTRTASPTSRDVCACLPQHTHGPALEHLGARRGAARAPGATRATRRAAHTHLGHTRTSLHVDARIHTPGSLQTRTLAPRKIPPTPRPIASNHPLPQPRTGRAHWRSHRLLQRTPGTPPGPSGSPPHTPPLPQGLSPYPRHRAHLLRGRPRAAPRAHTQEGPRALAGHPKAALAAQLGTSCSVSSFWGGGEGWGERGSGRRRGPGSPRRS